eukprot:Gb_38384 [translate_table: standard]
MLLIKKAMAGKSIRKVIIIWVVFYIFLGLILPATALLSHRPGGVRLRPDHSLMTHRRALQAATV